MSEVFDTIVVGAGQAGLAISYYLSLQKRNYVILEQASSIVPAWRSRWDSFTLVLPNWTLQMPDFPYRGDDPNGFMTRDEMVDYMEEFAASFDCNARFNCRVISIEKNPEKGNFVVRTPDLVYEAQNVVVTTGSYQMPKIPAIHSQINPQITQIHTSEYRHPEAVPSGAVLVVGSGQSGCQIAEELYQHGRKVYLCVGGAIRVDRFYRGRDIVWWLKEINFFDQTVDSLVSPKEKFVANPLITGKDGGHSLDLHQFASDGVVLLGRLKDAQGDKITLFPDLKENISKSDRFVSDLREKIDAFIETHQIDAGEASSQNGLTDGYRAEIIEQLDLGAQGINTIIWATGYRFDYSWIRFPVLDDDGYPMQKRGVSAIPGLYFLGMHWLYKRRSGLPWGVGEDAAYLAHKIETR